MDGRNIHCKKIPPTQNTQDDYGHISTDTEQNYKRTVDTLAQSIRGETTSTNDTRKNHAIILFIEQEGDPDPFQYRAHEIQLERHKNKQNNT